MFDVCTDYSFNMGLNRLYLTKSCYLTKLAKLTRAKVMLRRSLLLRAAENKQVNSVG